MKNRILKILKVFIDWLSTQYTRRLYKAEINLPYNSLSPTDNAEKVDDYLKAIQWALNKRDKIKNIAIAGPYGSGKSSIIKTFQERHKHNDEYKFLNISLATFKEENNNDNGTNNENKDDLLRLIELSILQQLFYHEKDTKIPDSRFKKIKSHKNNYLWFLTIGLLVFTVSFLHLVFPSFLAKFSLLDLTSENSYIFHYLSVSIFVSGALFIIFKSIRTLKRISVKKFGISNASIEIDDKISKSILNNHIDEILYFFEVTKYNTVIIEDLDRFEQTDVFTKLREINLLINNSKKIESDVVFIYAIRDDMFQDKDRTKFFDFMIPIIPVINFSNSRDKLLKIIQQNKYKISENLVDDISLFIDDMRLLYNVMNEYHLYSKKLNKTLSQDKLLSMVVYKNIYPNDFTKLSQNDGELYNTLIKKYLYITEKTSKIDDEILEIKNKIEKYENTKARNIRELRIIYLYKIIEKIGQRYPNQLFHKFLLNHSQVNMSQATEDNNFNLIRNTNSLRYIYHSSSNSTKTYNLNFTAIENEIDSELTYKEREGLLYDKYKIENLKKDSEKLENDKDKIKKYKIKDLISDNSINIKSENGHQKELIILLLRNGYIGEDYLDYISIFHEGSLSKNDHQFLINVKTQKISEFDYPLQKKENLLKRIDKFEFEKHYILNYDLLDLLITSSNYSGKKGKYFGLLASETESVIKFIDGYIDYTANIRKFIKYLCKEWLSIWDFIVTQSLYTEEKVEKYFRLIIEHAEVNDIKKIFSDFTEYISNNENFLLIIQDTQKLEKIIKELNIKFKILNETSPKELLDYVYDNNYYAINRRTISFFLDKKVTSSYPDIFYTESYFEIKNYSTIKLSKLDKLINYVDDNINEYVTNVYLSIDTNTEEESEYYIQLLNNKNISQDNKIKIIQQVKTLINDISKIEDFSIKKHLAEKSKMLARWDNLIHIYVQSENEFISEMTTFVNVIENAKKLSTNKIKTDVPDEETVKSFLVSLLLNNHIENKNYANVLSSIPYIYSSLNFENLSYEKVKLLIKNNKLTTNSTNFELLKQDFKILSISLIENNSNKFVQEIASFDIGNEDLLNLLKSKTIPVQLKEKIIENYNKTTFTQNTELLTQIGKLLLENSNMNIDREIILAVGIYSNLQKVDKIKLFNKWNRIYQKEDISNLLNSLGEPYSKMTKNGKRPVIDDNELNNEFAKNLKIKRYISNYDKERKGIRISTFRNK